VLSSLLFTELVQLTVSRTDLELEAGLKQMAFKKPRFLGLKKTFKKPRKSKI